MSTRTGRTTLAALAAATGMTLVVTCVGAGVAQATPGHPGTPGAPVVVFHEDFEAAPDTGARTMLSKYVTADGKHYTADDYWMSAPRANGLVLSWNNTKMPIDGTAADNGTEDTAFKVLRQLSEALGKVNGTKDPQTNTAISAYTQDTGKAPAGGKVMFKTDEDIALKDSNGRFLAFEMSAAATSAAANKPGVGREDPELMFYVSQAGKETALTTTPINPITDARASKVAVTALTGGAKEDIWAGQYASDTSFLYDGSDFGIVIRNMTSAHMGNDGAFDDIKVLDVTPQLDKQFGQREATTGDSVRLTFTVTNTAELARKTGWSFTDALPAGLVVAADPDVRVEGNATVQAAPGATAVTVTNGDLVAGDDAMTISLNVTSATAGTYTNGEKNITVHRGLDTPDSTTVTFKDPAPAPANLVVKYVDESGKAVADQDGSDGKAGDRYDTSAKGVPGYELVAVPTNATGTLVAGTTEVVYVYRPVPAPKTGDLVVRYVDVHGTTLADSDTDSGPVGQEYGSAAKTIDGFTLVEVQGEPNGRLTEGTTTVVYVYQPVPAPKAGDLVVTYVDEDGHEITGSDLSSGDVGAVYGTTPKVVDGYTLVTIPANATGTLTEGTTEVVYVYRKDPVAPAPADLTVRWLTEDGTPLADAYAYTGVVDEEYTTEAKTFDAYTLVAVPVNGTGALTAEPTEVVYIYRKNPPAPAPADLTVRFVDEQGNPLADPTHRDGAAGEHYDTTPATIDGYELVAVPANASGDMAEGTVVTYVYRKVVPAPTPTPTPEDTYVSEVLADPGETTAAGGLASTGSDAVAIGVLAAALATIGGLLVAVRRRRTEED